MIRLDRFEALADRLEEQPERFEFGTWSGKGRKPHHCGTNGCSLGHAVEMFGRVCGAYFDSLGGPSLIDGGGPFTVTRAIFGDLEKEDFRRLFIPGFALDKDCTAAEAAAEIRKFVAEQRAKESPI